LPALIAGVAAAADQPSGFVEMQRRYRDAAARGEFADAQILAEYRGVELAHACLA
jgi:hypothetical protein